MDTNVSCPVCTLYLRPGITLKTHLASHPKQKVIEALVRLAETDEAPREDGATQLETTSPGSQTVVNQTWNQGSLVNMTPNVQGNHVFIYQQSMSSTTTPQGNLLNPPSQQYVIPTVLNQQMMPYIYQQQVIMSSGSCGPMRGIYELPAVAAAESEVQEIPSESCEEETDKKESEEVEEDEDDPPEEDPIKNTDIDDPPELDETINESETTDEGYKTESELNKACQTLHDEVMIEEEGKGNPEFYFVDQPDNSTFVNIPQNPIYTPSNILQTGEHLDFVDIDGMHMVINEINDFSSGQIISQVENFDGNGPDRSGVLMTIGGMIDNSKEDFLEHRDADESMSRESSNVNIRADERMPPRGELSGQESLGGSSDITWNRIQYEGGGSGMSTSYDLVARESWGSDSSDVDVPPTPRVPQDFTEDDNETPTIVSFTGPPLNFKCGLCDEAFSCLRDRKDHELEKHPEKRKKSNTIGSEIGKSKVKKLVIKPKTEKQAEENNFDNVFTNKLKVETPADETTPEGASVTSENVDESLDVKTICTLCDCVVPNAKALKEHKLEVHKITPQRRHKCATCSEVFANDYKFSEHLRVHPLECKMCGRLFYRRQNLQLHMRRHLGVKPYKCDVCEKAFLTKQKLDEHRNIHTGEAPIKCNLCDETFRRHSNLVQHRNRHHFNIKRKVKDYICFCKEVFHSKKKLAWHKEIHDAKPKSCTQCNEKFIHAASLTRHMRRAHNDRFLPKGHVESENVECPICKGVYLKSSLEVHIRTHSGQRPFACLICNKDFTTKWNLKLHKWTHAARVSKPFKCDQCKGAFIRESDYTAHMNSHKSIRPYTCNYCGAQFIRKYNCQRHVKEHENEKMFNCIICGKRFHRSYYLKDHMRTHSGVRPYVCHICGKTSTTKSNHNKHVQIHHAREPVSTEN